MQEIVEPFLMYLIYMGICEILATILLIVVVAPLLIVKWWAIIQCIKLGRKKSYENNNL